MSKQVLIRFPDDEYEELAQEARAQDRSIPWVVRAIVRKHRHPRKGKS